MPVINTTSAFNVTLDDGRIVYVPAGESEQPDDVAGHWFTVAHLVGTPKGRMPMVKGPDGVMIEADEAGQRVHEGARLDMIRGRSDLRQEGPLSWSYSNPNAVAQAEVEASPPANAAETAVATERRAAVARTGRAAAASDAPAPRAAEQA